MTTADLLAHAQHLRAQGDEATGVLLLAVLCVQTMPEDALPTGSVEEGEFRFALETMITSGVDMIRLYNRVVPDSDIPEFECDVTLN